MPKKLWRDSCATLGTSDSWPRTSSIILHDVPYLNVSGQGFDIADEGSVSLVRLGVLARSQPAVVDGLLGALLLSIFCRVVILLSAATGVVVALSQPLLHWRFLLLAAVVGKVSLLDWGLVALALESFGYGLAEGLGALETQIPEVLISLLLSQIGLQRLCVGRVMVMRRLLARCTSLVAHGRFVRFHSCIAHR